MFRVPLFRGIRRIYLTHKLRAHEFIFIKSKLVMTNNTEDKLSAFKEIDETVKMFSLGLTNVYQPTLTVLKSQLIEITRKQEFLNDELHRENLRLSKAIYNDQFQEIFLKIKLYRDKLSLIKRDMMMINEQITKLKKRALKLEEQKQKEALEKVQRREYEELLISKSSTS